MGAKSPSCLFRRTLDKVNLASSRPLQTPIVIPILDKADQEKFNFGRFFSGRDASPL
jgi:hypothetical protein